MTLKFLPPLTELSTNVSIEISAEEGFFRSRFKELFKNPSIFPEKSGKECLMKLKGALVLVYGCMFSMGALAAGGIAGYEPAGAGDGKAPTVFTCQAWENGVVLTIENLVLVRIDREGQLPTGARTDKNEAGAKVSVLRYEDNPEAFSQGTMFAIPLGKNWPAKGPNIEAIDLERRIGAATVTGNKISIHVTIPQGAQWQPLNLVFEGSFGRAWGGVVGEGFQARNKNNSPLLLVGRDCQQPDKEVLGVMAGRL